MMPLSDWQRSGKYVLLKGCNVFYRYTGADSGIPILMLHGFPTSSWDWHKLWPELSQHYQLICLDFPGFGFSDKPKDSQYSIKGQCDVVEALLNHLSIDQCYLLTHDYGNTVGQELIARQLDGNCRATMHKIMMLNGGIFPESQQPLFIQQLLASPLGSFIASRMSYTKMAKSFAAICYQPLDKQLLIDYWQLINLDDGVKVIPQLLSYLKQRFRHRARWAGAVMTCPCPLRFVCGVQDPVSGQLMLERFEQLIFNADTVALENVGHYPQCEAPDKVIEQIKQYFR